MVEDKKPIECTPDKGEAPAKEVVLPEAGKGDLDDEMLPNQGEPTPQEEAGGNQCDTAGEHGEMAVEAARPIGERLSEAERQARSRKRGNR